MRASVTVGRAPGSAACSIRRWVRAKHCIDTSVAATAATTQSGRAPASARPAGEPVAARTISTPSSTAAATRDDRAARRCRPDVGSGATRTSGAGGRRVTGGRPRGPGGPREADRAVVADDDRREAQHRPGDQHAEVSGGAVAVEVGRAAQQVRAGARAAATARCGRPRPAAAAAPTSPRRTGCRRTPSAPRPAPRPGAPTRAMSPAVAALIARIVSARLAQLATALMRQRAQERLRDQVRSRARRRPRARTTRRAVARPDGTGPGPRPAAATRMLQIVNGSSAELNTMPLGSSRESGTTSTTDSETGPATGAGAVGVELLTDARRAPAPPPGWPRSPRAPRCAARHDRTRRRPSRSRIADRAAAASA